MQALIFDLDGTLIDTVYAHVFAWQRAFAEVGLAIDGWRIHRRIGMSGGLAARAAARELGREIARIAGLLGASAVAGGRADIAALQPDRPFARLEPRSAIGVGARRGVGA